MIYKIGFLGIGRSTFDTKLAEKNFQLLYTRLSSNTNNLTIFENIVYDDSSARKCLSFFKKNVCDYFIIFQTTFSDANFIVKFAKQFKDNFTLLSIRENRTGGRLRLNSICGLNLASHALQKNHYYPSLKIIDLKEKFSITKFNIQKNKKLKKKNYLKLIKPKKRISINDEIFKKIEDQTVGVIGKRPDGFHTCDFEKVELKQKLNTNVRKVNLNKLFKISSLINNKEINILKNKTKKYTIGIDKLNQKELNKSLSLYKGLETIKEKTKVDCLAIRCWPETFTKFGCAICGPMAMMNENLVSSSCEADVLGSVSSNILSKISGHPSLLVDIVDIRKSDQTAVMWHCGLAPKSMASGKIRSGIHSNRQKPLLFEFPFKEGKITIFRVSKARNKLFFFVKQGIILKRKNSFSGTSGVVSLNRSTYQKFIKLFKSGIEHHLSFTYGNYQNELLAIGKKLNIPVYTI